MANIYDMSDTWNDGATTFTSIKMNVTDTASASDSLLMDLQVGGTSQFSVAKSGDVIVPAESYFGVTGGSRFMARANSSRVYTGAVINIECVANDGVTIGPSLGILTGLNSARLYADAADTLAQRRSTNAQTFNLYNTYTDASNYERGFMKWNSNVLEIGTEAAGTGVNRSFALLSVGNISYRATTSASHIFGAASGDVLSIQTGSAVVGLRSTASLGWTSNAASGNGAPDVGLVRDAATIIRVTNGSTGGGAMQMTEMTAPAAPAANAVRIYAEDDGAGKTRLMARFATGAAVQIAIEP